MTGSRTDAMPSHGGLGRRVDYAEARTKERWVPTDRPHLWRDANSHEDPAHQRMKYTPPEINFIPVGIVLP